MEVCAKADCEEAIYARTLCVRHYQQARYHGTIPPSAATDRRCAQCGQLMVNRKSNKAKFCSPECKATAQAATDRVKRLAQKQGRACLQCATPIPQAVTGKAKFCSTRCSDTWHNAQRSAATLAAKKAAQRKCRGCEGPIPPERARGSTYCSVECKKKAQGAKWRAKSPGYMRQYLYGLTDEEYAALLEAQGHRCAICRRREWNGRHGQPHVDHDHKTKRVRGLLCDSCNNGLGRFKDDPDLLRAAISYLEGARLERSLPG